MWSWVDAVARLQALVSVLSYPDTLHICTMQTWLKFLKEKLRRLANKPTIIRKFLFLWLNLHDAKMKMKWTNFVFRFSSQQRLKDIKKLIWLQQEWRKLLFFVVFSFSNSLQVQIHSYFDEIIYEMNHILNCRYEVK